jgi:hypothetical protein
MGAQYRVPGTFQLAPADSSERIVFLFARSQTEMVRTADQAIANLERVKTDLISETLPKGPDVATYIVNRTGGQPAAVIRLTR